MKRRFAVSFVVGRSAAVLLLLLSFTARLAHADGINGAAGGAVGLWVNTNVEALHITPTGNVGIGTTSPNALLEVSHSGFNSGVRLTDTTNAANSLEISNFGVGSGIAFDPQANGGNFYFGRNFSLSNFVVQSGNVGIGTATPGVQLEISTHGSATPGFKITDTTNAANSLAINNFGSGAGVAFDPQGNGGNFYFGRNFSLSNFIVQSGNVGIGTTTPNALLDVVGTGPATVTI